MASCYRNPGVLAQLDPSPSHIPFPAGAYVIQHTRVMESGLWTRDYPHPVFVSLLK